MSDLTDVLEGRVRWAVLEGDCLEVLPRLPDSSVDCILTDPPYGWSFMGLDFDRALPDPRIWSECLRVLKPGGSAVVMSGSRLDCLWRVCRDIEEAGFELSQTGFVWCYRCVSEDTEVLTEDGWERYSKTIETKSVLCYNIDAGAFEFHKPRRSFVYENQHPAYRVRSDSTDQLLSRDHRCLVEREGKLSFETAASLALHSPAPVPILESLHDLPETIPDVELGTSIQKQDLLEALRRQVNGAQQDKQAKTEEANGETDRNGADHLRRLREEEVERTGSVEKNRLATNLFQQMPRHYARGRDETALGCGPLKPTEARMVGDRQASATRSDDWLKESGLEGRSDVLPQSRELQARQVRAVPAGVSTDGSEGRVCHGASATCCPGNQQAPVADRDRSPRQPRPAGQQPGESATLQEQSGTQTLREARGTKTTLASVEEVEYHGRMWCIEVPTGAFVARRNGRIFITGNSGFPKGSDLSKQADSRAFRSWLDSVDHGLTAAEVRQVASAAVGGCYGPEPPKREGQGGFANREGYLRQDGENVRPWQSAEQGAAGKLLSSLLSRHWHPLTDEQKRAAWAGYGEPDLERPPGVRVNAGEHPFASRRPNVLPGHGETVCWEGGDIGTPSLTAPATEAALALSGQFSKGKVKPCWEIILWARKPISEKTELDNVLRWGVGGVNCGAGMIPFAGNVDQVEVTAGIARLADSNRDGRCEARPYQGQGASVTTGIVGGEGRYPPNLLVTDQALSEEGSRFFDIERWSQEHGFTEDGWAEAAEAGILQIAKASKSERHAGLPMPKGEVEYGARPCDWEKANWKGNNHPCLKPVKLFAYLAALLCPAGSVILDPFCGSGTTGVAAVQGGWPFVGVDLSEEYCTISRARILYAEREGEEKQRQQRDEQARKEREAEEKRRQEQPALALEAAGG